MAKEEKKIQRLTLTKPVHVRRYLARIAKDVENGDMDLATARVLNSLSDSILKGIRTDEHEMRLDELEDRIKFPEKYEVNETADFTDFLKYKREHEQNN